MPRLLLVAHRLPPYPSAGALRPGFLMQYLPEFGWDVRALCAPGNAAVPDTRSAQARTRIPPALRRIGRAALDSLLFPDPAAPWMAQAVRTGRAMLAREPFDAILSTAHPPSAHAIAWLLARSSGLPWIADYRDPWAGNAYLHRGPVRGALERAFERAILRRAQRITTISDAVAAQIGAFHGRSVTVIPNGYDPGAWSAVPDAPPAGFDLCFTGSMYDGKRSPDLLFAAIRSLRDAGEPAGHAAAVHFYGPNTAGVLEAAQRAGVADCVHLHGVVPRAQAMQAQRQAAALLIFLNMDPATAAEMGSKYLEYLGARRFIMAFGPQEGALRAFLERSGAGRYASGVQEAVLALDDAYRRFASGAWETSADAADAPTTNQMAARFADVLNGAVSACGKSASPSTAPPVTAA